MYEEKLVKYQIANKNSIEKTKAPQTLVLKYCLSYRYKIPVGTSQ